MKISPQFDPFSFILFFCWPGLFVLGFSLYGQKNSIWNIIVVTTTLELLTLAASAKGTLQGSILQILCLTTFVLVWLIRKRALNTAVISATILGVGVLTKDIVFVLGDLTTRSTEGISMVVIFTVLAHFVLSKRLQFTFTRIPSIIVKHGKKAKVICVKLLILLLFSGYITPYISIKFVSVCIIFGLVYIMLHSVKMEFES